MSAARCGRGSWVAGDSAPSPFYSIGKSIQPETGKLVAWNNRRPDGSLNPATIHHGMKVREGTKYVITKWYRERSWGW